MKRLVIFGILGLLIFNPSLASADNRNYPLRLMIAAMASGGVGLVLTVTSLWAGSDIDSSNSTIHFKSDNWKNTFYASLGLDAAGLILFGTAMVFACCKIGYTPIDDTDF